MKRFSVLASITATLLFGSVAGHAQSPEIQKFFVFDAHMHPMANAYRGGWNVGDPNDPQFSLSMARQGGLGAVFANTSVDEFYSVNHIAVKEVLRQFDHMYRQVVLYPDQLGIARDADQVCGPFRNRANWRLSCRFPVAVLWKATWQPCGCCTSLACASLAPCTSSKTASGILPYPRKTTAKGGD